MSDKDIEEVQEHMARANITDRGELGRLQQKQRAAVERYKNRDRAEDSYPSPPNSAGLHPDLQELSFGEIGSSQKSVPSFKSSSSENEISDRCFTQEFTPTNTS